MSSFIFLLLASLSFSHLSAFDVHADDWILSPNCQGVDNMGGQGSTSDDDCIANCFTNGNCRFVTRAFSGQCEWFSGFTCSSKPMLKDEVKGWKRDAKSFPKGWYWSGTMMGAGTVLAKKNILLKDALSFCLNLHNCTSFMFHDDEGPFPNATREIQFLDDPQILDADQLSRTWGYYKNATEIPFCDVSLDPSFAVVSGDTKLILNWRNCEGPDMHAVLVDGGGISIEKMDLKTSGSAFQAQPTKTELGTKWEVQILSNSKLIYSIVVPIVASMCQRDGIWDAAQEGHSITLDCWVLTTNFTAGTSTRYCHDGKWSPVDTGKCTMGGMDRWSRDFLNYISDSQESSDRYVATSNNLNILMYFPGNKLYGWSADWKGLEVDCNMADPEDWDIPGNVVGPDFRRLQIAGMKANWLHPVEGCDRFTMRILISVFSSDRHGQNTFYINDWIEMKGSKSGDMISVTSNSTRLRWETSVRSYRGAPIFYAMLYDKTEFECMQEVDQECGSRTNGTDCLKCAWADREDLQGHNCTVDTNWKNTVNFFCTCRFDNSCAGPWPKNVFGGHILDA